MPHIGFFLLTTTLVFFPTAARTWGVTTYFSHVSIATAPIFVGVERRTSPWTKSRQAFGISVHAIVRSRTSLAPEVQECHPTFLFNRFY
ncbi:hypothetical protein D1BOALGB6SA_4211 [Olavius sp. associated proteobacterium Delta 1]|nr:hypothetical protein D1BOALGB6SA_4211 [Olavius sp. associated proteobacterium Delta 1]